MTKLARQIVLIIDNSASMNTREATLSRLESAKQRALKLVDNLRFIDEMMVISCDTQPIIHSPFTNHQKSLRAAIASIQPTVVKTDLAPALSLAYSVTQTNTNPEIVVLSDFAIGAQSQQVAEMLQNPPPHAKLHLFPAADKVSDNVGITKFRVRKSIVNAFDYQTLLTVANTSDAEKPINVELYLNDGLLDVRPYTLAPGEDRSEIFSNFTFEGGRLKAVLDVDDVLSTDNAAYAALPKREQIPVLLVTRGNTFL